MITDATPPPHPGSSGGVLGSAGECELGRAAFSNFLSTKIDLNSL